MPKDEQSGKKKLAKAIRKAKREAEIQAGFIGKLYTRVADKGKKSRKAERAETKRKLNKGEYDD
jgi:hypothetical protein